MMWDYFIYYTTSNVFCIIIFGLLLIHDWINKDKQESQIKFDRALIAFMLYFASDSFCSAVEAGVVPLNRFSIILSCLLLYIFMAAITYLWLDYVMTVEKVPNRNNQKTRFAIIFPFIISSIAIVVTYIFAPQLFLNEKLEVQIVFNIFQIIVPCINIAAVLIYTLKKAKQEENKTDKIKHLYIGFLPLMVIIGGLIQVLFFYKIPIFCFSSTILMFVFYIKSMEDQISIDPLTQLNNRRQLINYASQISGSHKDYLITFVMMIDVNDFKSINDTFGHSEGDKALTIIADSLRKVVGKHKNPKFLGRYGGDEFIIIVHPNNEEEIQVLIDEIREQIISLCKEQNTPYILTVGIGYDELMTEQDTIQKCIQRADEKLYIDKDNIKKSINSAS